MFLYLFSDNWKRWNVDIVAGDVRDLVASQVYRVFFLKNDILNLEKTKSKDLKIALQIYSTFYVWYVDFDKYLQCVI